MLIRLGACVTIFGCFLFAYLEKQNELTHIKIQLPELEKRLGILQEEGRRLSYEVDQFENPAFLIELVKRPEFGHLKHPLLREILTVPEAIATNQ